MFGNQNKPGAGLFLNQTQQPPQSNVFLQNQTLPNNNFTNKTTSGLGIFNPTTNQNTNQPNLFTNTQQPPTNNFYPQQQQQPPGLGFLNRPATTTTPGVFNQTPNTTPQVGGGFLNQAPTTTSPANFLNQNSLGGNTQFNLPNQIQSPGFLPNTSLQQPNTIPQMNVYQAFPIIQLTDANMQQVRSAPIQQKKQYIEAFHHQQIKKMIEHFRKPIEFLKTDRLQLTPDNPLRSEKITQVATALNIKRQVLYVKKEVKKNLTDRIKSLKEDKQKLDSLANDFPKNVFPKLRKYKQQLLFAISQNKMIEQVQKEMGELENQLKEFFKPMFNAQQNKYCLSFVDPNRFCIRVTEKLYKNMISLNNLMDDLLVSQGNQIEGNVDAGDVILELIEYYQNVAVALKDYTSKYNELKKKLLKRGRAKNPEQILRKLSQMANLSMNKDMQPYELVKEIQCLLEKREQKLIPKDL